MKTFLLLILFLVFGTFCSAQSCGNSGSGICTTTLDPFTDTEGFHPSNSNQVPCAVRGTAYSQTVQMIFPTAASPENTSSTYGVNSWRIDSIQNLPCGLCWATNNSSNFFFPLTDVACIRFTGTTYDVPGQYKLRIKLRMNATSGLSYTNQNADHFEWELWLRVADDGSFCPNINTGQPSLVAASVTSTIATPTISPAGPITLCQGGSTTLTASAGYAAYLWSNGATTQSINVTQAGNYSVKVYKNCDDATSAAVQVIIAQGNALIATAATADTFCLGGSVTINATGGFTNYLWSGGQTTSSITVNQSGNYNVSANDPSVGCTTNSNTVHVEVLPPNFNVTITSDHPDGICSGTAAVLSAGGGYSSYLWSTGATTQSINVNSPDNYTVTVTHPEGGCTGAGGLNVLSLPVPDGDMVINDIIQDSVVCEGETIELVYTELDYGSITFQWRRNGIAVSGATHSYYDATQDGYYTCEMQKSGGCSVTSTGYQLTFLPLPGVSFQLSEDSLCLTDSPVVLSGGQPSGGYYMIDGNILTTTIDPSQLSAGVHTVSYNYTNNNNCTGSAGDQLVIQNCLGVDNLFRNSIKIYPNPFREEIIVTGESGLIYKVELTDVLGIRHFETNTSQSSLRIATDTFGSGIYFVKVTANGEGNKTAVYRIAKY